VSRGQEPRRLGKKPTQVGPPSLIGHRLRAMWKMDRLRLAAWSAAIAAADQRLTEQGRNRQVTSVPPMCPAGIFVDSRLRGLVH
jgi:hypothetical protein